MSDKRLSDMSDDEVRLLAGAVPDGKLNAALDRIRSRIADTKDGFSSDPVSYIRSAGDTPRLLAALDEVLKLHTRQETPVQSWDLDLRCEKHQWTRNDRYGPFKGLREHLLSVRNCPDCTCRETHPCTHCREDDWPCPEVQAISRALLGEDGSDE
jgi:hypothetical protein